MLEELGLLIVNPTPVVVIVQGNAKQAQSWQGIHVVEFENLTMY